MIPLRPEISINLATHNRAAFLEPCLESLCTQTIDASRYEICVVANACTDDTPTIVERVGARFPRHRLFMVEEPVAGLSRARNKGIAATAAPFIANIDDDATAVPKWLESALNRFAGLPGDIAVIGGEIEPVWMAPPPDWLSPWMKGALSAASNMGPVPRYIEAQENVFEGNCCYRRAALESVGLYPVELGRAGNLLLSGEGALNLLIRQRGWKLYFDPAMLILHTIHADRLTPLWFRKRFFWQGVSGYAARCYHQRHGLKFVNELTIDLPLAAADWAFTQQDAPSDMRQSLMQFESLGMVLAMSGIIPLEG
jgi:glycosyltransferase involved in cell wall biosynthesis